MTLFDSLILLLINSLLIFVFAFVGFLFKSAFVSNRKNQTPSNLGAEIIIGFFITIVIYSLFIANYKTVNVLFLMLLILYFFVNKKSFSFQNISFKLYIKNLKSILPVVFVLFLFSTIQWIKEYDGGNLHLYYRDYNFYISAAESFNNFGAEANKLWYNIFDLGSIISKKPYHYFDIWINSFLLRLSNISSVQIYVFQFIPLVITLSVLAFSKIFISIYKLKPFKSLIISSFIIITVGTLVFKDGFSANLYNYPKYLASFILFPFLAISFFNKDYLNTTFTACIILLLHPIYLPSVFGAIGIFYLLMLIRKKEKRFLYYMSLLFFFSFIYYIYFKILGEGKPGNLTFENYFDADYFKTFFKKLFFDNIIRLPVFYFSISISIIILIIKKNTKLIASETFVLFALIAFIGIFFSLAIINRESFALSAAVLNSSLLIILCFLLGYSLTSLRDKKNKFLNSVVIGVIVLQALLSWIYTFSNKSFQEITISKQFYYDVKDKDLSEIGCYFVASDKYLNSQFGNPHVPAIGGLPHLIDRESYIVSLSVFNKRNNKEVQKIMQNTPFYKFVEMQKKDGSFESIENSQILFIRKYKINYAVFEADCPYPESLKSFNRTSISDSLSGITFVYIDN